MSISSFKSGDEAGRLAAVNRFEVLDTESEKEFGDIVSLVKSIFNVPRAAINILDHDRQWAKAGAGEGPGTAPRAETFCQYTIRDEMAFAVRDAVCDTRFSDNPFVTGPCAVRSYLGVPLTTADGYNIGTLCIFDSKPRDFSEAEVDVLSNFAKVVMSQLERRLSSRLDSLTGALTSRAFHDRLERHRSLRMSTPATLILVDIDHFKSVNDRFGHAAGDEVLRILARRLRTLIRKSDSFGRLGGEEFGMLITGTSPEETQPLVARIQEGLAGLEIDAIGGARITCSMGIAGFQPRESRESWFERADRALYQAKHAGRNRAVLAQLTL